MKRVRVEPRPGWSDRLEADGFDWHRDFWQEDACWEIDAATASRLESAAAQAHSLLKAVCSRVIECGLWEQLSIPPHWAERITHSWQSGEPGLSGRFDFLLDPEGQPRLLEYNGDTATTLLESALIQKDWLTDRNAEGQWKQFNRLHESLVTAWEEERQSRRVERLHLSWLPGAAEYEGTVRYLARTAREAGIECRLIPIHLIGWNDSRAVFVDRSGDRIATCMKLYPWDWMLEEPFGQHLVRSGCRFIQPAWKLLMSHKGLLALAWEWFSGEAILLPASWERKDISGPAVGKPVLGREGCNIRMDPGGDAPPVSSGGPFGAQPLVWQEFVNAPRCDGWLPQWGVWMIAGQPAGAGIRESRDSIISNDSFFAPHRIVQGQVDTGKEK